jgi:hypothetical protein
MCKVSIDINEDIIREVLPELEDTAAIRIWAQMLIDSRLRELVAKEDETRRKLSQDMSVEELYNVIAEEIDSIYANG